MSHLGASDFISYWEDALRSCSQCVRRKPLGQSHKHTHKLLHTMDQGAPLKDISIDIEISEEEEEVSSLLEQREIYPNDTPGVREAQTKGQYSLAAHSITKALIKDRDPKGINKCLKVSHTINTVQTNGLLLFSGLQTFICILNERFLQTDGGPI